MVKAHSYVASLHRMLLEGAQRPINKRNANAYANSVSAALIMEECPEALRRALVGMLRSCASVNAMPTGLVVWLQHAEQARTALLAYFEAHPPA